MDLKEVKTYLEKHLPEFSFISGKDTPHEQNWNSILVEREGQQIAIDVSKVETKKHLKNLKAYIQGQWEQYEKIKNKH